MFGRNKPAFVPATHLSPKHTVKLRRISDVTKPAVSVDLVKKAGASFEKKVNSAVKMNLEKGGSNKDVRWSVIGLLDESYSMDPFFFDGTVQEVVDRALAWCATKDADGMAPFGGFASGHVWHSEIDLTTVNNVVAREGWSTWGGTNLTASLQAILDMILDMGDGWEMDPILLFIVTDGQPNDQESVKRLICELSQYPVFVKILRVGNNSGAKAFTEYLDNMEQHSPGSRLFDNVDCPEKSLYKGMPDDKFNADMTEETDSALAGMKSVGLVTE